LGAHFPYDFGQISFRRVWLCEFVIFLEAFKPFLLGVAFRGFRCGRAGTPGAPLNTLHRALSREDSKTCMSWRLADESKDAGLGAAIDLHLLQPRLGTPARDADGRGAARPTRRDSWWIDNQHHVVGAWNAHEIVAACGRQPVLSASSGPNICYDERQIIRAGLEDHFMGKFWPADGCDVCYNESRRPRPKLRRQPAAALVGRRLQLISWAFHAPTT